MNAEVSFFGLYAPGLLVCAPLAYILASLLRLALTALGIYRFLWHRGLFNVAIFVCLLGVLLHFLSRTSL
ncbi:DUF1656 domain-containing protein [Methylocystis sp. MJC1]|jgi:hypothetical protein|uniref:DUF1656 domain-containing protein n=1 Tax=Methylocystis sp. MJC1 TaxID=2654282 RepID=UPI0013E9BE38|nr:DUF1656 domain-containing protein [Methylocystis sp. MJC1]KAF2992496.1 Protein AaeX [Methylocystis sp. MJC1]MBU6526473.1 DUF1656 domain-containing protein [Methylocystis sp. MJC1]UZX12914.1 DUF1656 domain-containing protein [Methylocystis sp. MJC1]